MADRVRGAKQAWVAGTVIRVLGAIDTVAVAQNIPPVPTAAPKPTAAPQPTAAPVAAQAPAGVDYKIVETRMLNINENGGCMGKHNFYVQVVDAGGAPVNGAVIGRVWAPQETAIAGQKDCFWNIGVMNEGCAHFDIYNASDNVLVLADPTLRARQEPGVSYVDDQGHRSVDRRPDGIRLLHGRPRELRVAQEPGGPSAPAVRRALLLVCKVPAHSLAQRRIRCACP